MKDQTEIESIIQEQLDELKPVPPRNQQMAARARARFLAQGMTAGESQRHKGWGFIFRKQQFAMNGVLALLVIIGLLISGATTVRAAQDDLPNQPLYAIKILSEDISLQFERSPEARVERLMQLAQIRVQEMTRMVEAGQTPPERLRLRLERHIEETLELSSNMDDAALDRTLLQVRDQLQQQERDLERLQTLAGQNSQPILEHTHTMLQSQLYIIDDGLLDHETFRNEFRHGQGQKEQDGQATFESGDHGNGVNHPNGPNAHMTPTPKKGDKERDSKNKGGGNDGRSGGKNP